MANKSCLQNKRSGFTIIELLVVIGIIVILLGILLPVVNSIHKTAQKADSSAEITKIATAIHNYYQDYRSFPGPVADSNIYGFNNTVTSITAPPIASTPAVTQISSTQNLTLGILGGLSVSGTGYTYTSTLVTTGPQSLNVATPQQMPPYFDAQSTDLANNGAGTYVSWTSTIPAPQPAGTVVLSAVPELMDHFSNPHPIIYLRAKLGGTTMVDAAGTSQYYSMEMAPYWVGTAANNGTVPKPGTVFPTLADANNGNVSLYPTPPGASGFFNNTSLNDNVTPRSKDTFILISAGYDGIYGTSDDIVYSN